jgi:DNA invertase Pin-like site-specific DNA recombinase
MCPHATKGRFGSKSDGRDHRSSSVTIRQRAPLRRLLTALEGGDVLLVTRLDRLARSTRDLLNTLAASPTRKPISAPLATHGPTPRPRMGG